MLERLEGKKNDFINTMFAGIPENQRCVYTSVSFFEKSTYLEDRENLWLNPEEFKDDQGKPLLQFVYETGMVTNTRPSTNLCAFFLEEDLFWYSTVIECVAVSRKNLHTWKNLQSKAW